MIVSSIADFQVTKDDLVQFNFRPIRYEIKGSKSTIEGEVPVNSYAVPDASATGAPPYTVTLGYVNESYTAKPVQVNSNDSLVTFSMGFPAGPNFPQTFIYSKF
ncbi:MAG TPA: hypothetical protein VI756_10060 [Blastocatellia bacterium]